MWGNPCYRNANSDWLMQTYTKDEKEWTWIQTSNRWAWTHAYTHICICHSGTPLKNTCGSIRHITLMYRLQWQGKSTTKEWKLCYNSHTGKKLNRWSDKYRQFCKFSYVSEQVECFSLKFSGLDIFLHYTLLLKIQVCVKEQFSFCAFCSHYQTHWTKIFF